MVRNNITIENLPGIEDRLQHDPNDVDALVELAALRFGPGHDPRTAEELLHRAIALKPGSVDARFWLSKVRFHDYVDLKGARQLLEEALRLDPQRADCLSLLASVLADLDEEPINYVTYLQRAVTSEPGWPSLRLHHAQVLLKLDDIDGADAQIRAGLAALQQIHRGPAKVSYYDSAVTGCHRPEIEDDLLQLLVELARRRRRRT